MAPGPTPTLTTSAPASTRSRTPSAATTLPATSGIRAAGPVGQPVPDIAYRLQRLQHLLLVPVRGVDDEHVDPGAEQRARPARPRHR